MHATAAELGALGIATLRYQFPYMEQRRRRTDAPAVCHATVRAAVAETARLQPALPLFAGGRSFGGRMTSQAQALAPLPGVRGLAFLGFPLHPAGRPSDARAQHLPQVHITLLFLQGTRDALAQPDLIAHVIADLGKRATLKSFAEADHSFHVPKRSGSTDALVMAELCDTVAAWVETTARWVTTLKGRLA